MRELEAAAEKSGISGSDGTARVGGGYDGREGPGLDDVETTGRGTAVGVESSLVPAASLSCKVLTLRVRNSTFDVSFFSVLRNLQQT